MIKTDAWGWNEPSERMLYLYAYIIVVYILFSRFLSIRLVLYRCFKTTLNKTPIETISITTTIISNYLKSFETVIVLPTSAQSDVNDVFHPTYSNTLSSVCQLNEVLNCDFISRRRAVERVLIRLYYNKYCSVLLIDFNVIYFLSVLHYTWCKLYNIIISHILPIVST